MVESTLIWQNYNLNEIEPTSKGKWFPNGINWFRFLKHWSGVSTHFEKSVEKNSKIFPKKKSNVSCVIIILFFKRCVDVLLFAHQLKLMFVLS